MSFVIFPASGKLPGKLERFDPPFLAPLQTQREGRDPVQNKENIRHEAALDLMTRKLQASLNATATPRRRHSDLLGEKNLTLRLATRLIYEVSYLLQIFDTSMSKTTFST